MERNKMRNERWAEIKHTANLPTNKNSNSNEVTTMEGKYNEKVN